MVHDSWSLHDSWIRPGRGLGGYVAFYCWGKGAGCCAIAGCVATVCAMCMRGRKAAARMGVKPA